MGNKKTEKGRRKSFIVFEIVMFCAKQICLRDSWQPYSIIPETSRIHLFNLHY